MQWRLFLVLLLSSLAVAQGGRIGSDGSPAMAARTVGGVLNVLSGEQVAIQVCVHPANGAPCTNKVTTYTDVTLLTPCPTSAQVVLAGTSNCVAASDSKGNWGAWVAPGTYDYTYTDAGGNSPGPFTITAAPDMTVAPWGNKPWVDAVRDCGAKGDNVTDDFAAVNACMTASPHRVIFFPASTYYISQTLNYKGGGQIIQGENGRWTASTILRFPSGVGGIFCDNNVAAGVQLRDIELLGGDAWNQADASTYTVGTADGVGIGCGHFHAANVLVQGFNRHGWNIIGDAPYNGDTWQIDHSAAFENRGDGLHAQGSDSNAGLSNNFFAQLNGGWGIYENSFLGNTHIQPHTDGNHYDNTTANNQVSISNHARASHISTITTSTPHGLSVGSIAIINDSTDSSFGNGTDNQANHFYVLSTPTGSSFTYYQALGDVGSGAATGTVKRKPGTEVWVANGTTGGSYWAANTAAYSVIVGGYSEANQPPAQVGYRTIYISGDHGSNFDYSIAGGGANLITTNAGGMQMTPFRTRDHEPYGAGAETGPQFIVGKGLNTSQRSAWAAVDADGGTTPPYMVEFRKTTDPDASNSPWWGFRVQQVTDPGNLRIYPLLLAYGQTTESNSGINPMAWAPNGLLFGGWGAGSTARMWLGNVDATANLPTWFTQNIGSIAIKKAVAAGGFAGWIATSAGSPGTYNAFGPVATDSAGTVWTLSYNAPAKSAVGSLTSCAAGTEGAHAVATDCNAGCVAGNSCTTGGATHCEMYCNGSGWVETGR